MKQDTFIKEYKKAFSSEYCKKAIEVFEMMKEQRQTIEQNNIKKNQDDRIMYDWAPGNGIQYYDHKFCQHFFQTVHQFYDKYVGEYDILETIEGHSPKGMCIQRTGPKQGYHVWHVEDGGQASCNRVVAYTLYLNDVEEGGETEYLYQGVKVKPEEGKLVFWPAGYTHPHRGNPIYEGYKYIITGWYTYDS